VIKVRAFVLALSVAAGAALAQDAPTGIVKSGGVALLRTQSKTSAGLLGTIDTTTDFFAGGFQSTDYSKITLTRADATTIGACVVTTFPALATSNPITSAVTPLDAGPVLNLNGPNGSKQFPATKFAYGGIVGGGLALPIPGLPPAPPLYLDPGTYTVDNGGGGADIGPFKATLTVPDPFTWTNADANLSIDRAAGVDVVWTGGDPGSKVNIVGAVTLIDSATSQVKGGGAFTCIVDNSAGHYFVPPEVLTLLPASVVVANAPLSTLSVSTGVQVKFDAPGSDLSLFSFSSGGSRNVEYK
jgi:hypothetical protein